jgi:hypothetical protein
MVLTNYFLKKETERLIRLAPERPHQYRSMSDVKDVLFVCNSEDWEQARACIEKLRAMKKNVGIAIYSPTSKEVPTWYAKYTLLKGDADVTLWGFPAREIQHEFNCQKADLLLDFTGETSAVMYYLVLQHPATFKCGVKRSPKSEYDLAIIQPEKEESLTFFFEQIVKYLQLISSK